MEEPRRHVVIIGAVAAYGVIVLLLALAPAVVRLVLPTPTTFASTVRRVTLSAPTVANAPVAQAAPVKVETPVVLTAPPQAEVKRVRVRTGERARVSARVAGAGAREAAGAGAREGAGAGEGEGARADADPASAPVSAPAPEPVPAPDPEPSIEDVTAWSNTLAVLIATRLTYPPDAAEDELEGTVLVAIEVGADGAISEVKLAKSSGEVLLDGPALRQVQALGKVPAPPGGRPRVVRVPVRFRLDR